MTDRATTMTTEQRVATALERIEDVLTEVLERIPSPPRARETVPPDKPPTEAHYVYLSGQWKRRDGHGVQKSVTLAQHTVGSPPIGTQLDPWVRRDTPAIEPYDGETGLGQATSTAPIDS